jgi:RimJ/RimL family protein N-acetyltransferase
VDCALPTLRGDRVVLRPPAQSDVDALADALLEPEVARWWSPDTREQHRAGFVEDVRERGAFAIEVGGVLAGFRPVGIMHRYERGADGAWPDGLLMDMLAGELR